MIRVATMPQPFVIVVLVSWSAGWPMSRVRIRSHE
ncbi:MAG: hypothetical protein CM1200mP2_23020 [Planctomycetaceae bacterium]|nr:MAG: hypothetical protein CM1200mP2_23020 [Planctomycetaceae bacterium]